MVMEEEEVNSKLHTDNIFVGVHIFPRRRCTMWKVKPDSDSIGLR